jgi:hypothetical protein
MRNIRNAKSGKIDLRSLKAAIKDTKADRAKLAELAGTITDQEDPQTYFRGFVTRTIEAINGGYYNP